MKPHVDTLGVQVVTENALVQQSQSFEQAVRGGEREAMVAFCDSKAASATGNETETWAFLKILFESDPQRCASCLEQPYSVGWHQIRLG